MSIAVGGWMDAYLTELARLNRSPRTINETRLALLRLRKHVSPAGLLDVTTEQVRDWLSRPISPATQATELGHVRGYFDWAITQGLTGHDPTRGLRSPKIPRRLPRPIPDDHLQRALDTAHDPVRSWLMLAAYAGLRATEIAKVRGEDIRWPDRVLLVPVSKGGGASSVPLAEPLAYALERYRGTLGWLFPGPDGYPIKPNSLCHQANGFLHAIGIDSTLHTLRHWYGTGVYRATGRDLRLTQELMRHRSPVSTAVYTWLDPREGVQAVNALPVFSGR